MINPKMNLAVEEDVSGIKTLNSVTKQEAQLQEMPGQGLLAIKAARFAGYFLILSMTA